MQHMQDKITAGQLAIIVVSTIIGVNLLLLPRGLVEVAGRDGWISLLLAGGYVMLVVIAGIILSLRFPTKMITEYSQVILGKPLGKLYNILGIAFYVLAAANIFRQFGDAMKVFLLEKTPLEVLLIVGLLVVAYQVNHGLNAMARLGQVFLPVILLPLGLIFLMAQYTADYRELLPVLSRGPIPVLKAFPRAYTVFAGWGIVLFLVAPLRKKKLALPAGLAGIIMALIVYLVTSVLIIATFGEVQVKYFIYPLMDLARFIELPGAFIERFEALLLSLWILAVFYTVEAIFYVSALGLSQTVELKEHRVLVYLLVPVIYLLAMLPQDFSRVLFVNEILGWASLALSVTVPALLLVAIIRGKEEKAVDQATGEQS